MCVLWPIDIIQYLHIFFRWQLCWVLTDKCHIFTSMIIHPTYWLTHVLGTIALSSCSVATWNYIFIIWLIYIIYYMTYQLGKWGCGGPGIIFQWIIYPFRLWLATSWHCGFNIITLLQLLTPHLTVNIAMVHANVIRLTDEYNSRTCIDLIVIIWFHWCILTLIQRIFPTSRWNFIILSPFSVQMSIRCPMPATPVFHHCCVIS